MLSKHDLYPKIGGALRPLDLKNGKTHLDIILELLFYCDGEIGLYELSIQLDVDLNTLYDIGINLIDKDVLEVVN